MNVYDLLRLVWVIVFVFGRCSGDERQSHDVNVPVQPNPVKIMLGQMEEVKFLWTNDIRTAYAKIHEMATNNVDAVFEEINMDPRCSLWEKCTEAGFRELTGNRIGLRQYVFNKLLVVPVETNMWFSSRFNDKYDLIEEAVDVLSLGALVTDGHLKEMLLDAASS